MRVMVIEVWHDTLIEERYRDTIMGSSASLVNWDTIEVSPEDFYRYEQLRIELEELTWKLMETK